MPCRDDARVPIESAGLCALLNALKRADMLKSVLAFVDWQKAGITERELNNWWRAHQASEPEIEW